MSRLTTFNHQDEQDVVNRIIASTEEEINNEFPQVRTGSFNRDEPTVISQDRLTSSQTRIKAESAETKPRTWFIILFLGIILLVIASWLANYID